MRSKRINKYRVKYRPLIVGVKLVLISYLMIFSISYLTSGTSAFFSSYQTLGHEITAGEWNQDHKDSDQWDQSSLTFQGKGNQNIKSCPTVIEVEIMNDGEDMQHDTKYEIFYIKNGNPQKHGEKIDLHEEEGIISALKSGEIIKLSYETDVSGVYVFAAYQQDGHPNEEQTWSEKIKVDCKSTENSSKSDNKQQIEEDNLEKDHEKSEQQGDQGTLAGEDSEQITNGENSSDANEENKTLTETQNVLAEEKMEENDNNDRRDFEGDEDENAENDKMD